MLALKCLFSNVAGIAGRQRTARLFQSGKIFQIAKPACTSRAARVGVLPRVLLAVEAQATVIKNDKCKARVKGRRIASRIRLIPVPGERNPESGGNGTENLRLRCVPRDKAKKINDHL